jgi:hypothetical protein
VGCKEEERKIGEFQLFWSSTCNIRIALCIYVSWPYQTSKLKESERERGEKGPLSPPFDTHAKLRKRE